MTTVKLTPELFGEFPRRSAATPNSEGTYAIYTVSSYSFDASVETKETKTLNLKDNKHSLFSDDPNVASPQWLKGNQVMWQKSNAGKTELFAGTVGTDYKSQYFIGSIDAPISNVKTEVLSEDSIVLCFSAPVNAAGELLNPESLPKPKSTAREYETVRVRYWDYWHKPYSSALFYTTLYKLPNKDAYKLREQPAVNILLGTSLRFPFVDGPFGEGAAYDVSKKGIVFTTPNPTNNIALRQNTDTFFVPVSSYEEASQQEPMLVEGPACTGSSSATVFSPDATKFAFLKSKSYLIDWWGPVNIFVASTDDPKNVTKVLLNTVDGTEWDRSPEDLLWSADGKTIYLNVPDSGRQRLWKVDVSGAAPDKDSIAQVPRVLTKDGTVSAVYRLSDSPNEERLFFSATSLIDNSYFATVNTKTREIITLSSNTEHGSLLGINKAQVSEFTCKSKDGTYEIPVWMVTPPDLDPKKKYPVAIFAHGGPQVAWFDQWSHRWCPALYAAQGYVVIVPNFTGSSSYGYDYANDISSDWGGRAYDDIVQSFEYLKQNMPYADTGRAVAMGGSFGGYMMNWIEGQPLGKELKALVNHNGIWSLPTSIYSSDTAIGEQVEFGGHFWENKDAWNRNDPAQFTANWSTPMLIIHSDNDFRCPLDQGIAPFMVCQAKGIPSRLLNFPDENHFVTKRENQLHWYKTIFGWINKYTGVEGGITLAPPVSEPIPTHVKK